MKGRAAPAVRPLERFALPVRPELDLVEQRIAALLSQMGRRSVLPELCAEYVQPAVEHLFRSGGKLLRPLLVLLAARSTGPIEGSAEAVTRAAAAVELIHTASLAHDDMVDAAAERRGVPSLHAEFGTTTAVLVGDLFYSRFFQELAGIPGTAPALRIRLLESFLRVTERMCEGEILEEQMRAAGRPASLEVYLHITETKTADLVAACCLAGALLNGAPEEVVVALEAYGRSLGLLFQIADDLADGDGILADRDAMRALACDYQEQAESHLRCLGGNDAADMLRALPGFILSRA